MSVPTGAFVVRRKGKVFVTGNSQGFPKSHNISKAIDAKLGAEREVIGKHPAPAGNSQLAKEGGYRCKACGHKWAQEGQDCRACPECEAPETQLELVMSAGDSLNMSRVGMPDKAYITASATDEAKQWEGYGTALKPSWEPILVFRKPMDGTVAETVLEFGTGGLNIDGTRVKHSDASDFEKHKAMVDRLKEQGGSMSDSWKNSSDLAGASEVKEGGRWPTNVLMTHAPGCKQRGAKKVPAAAPAGKPCGDEDRSRGVYGNGDPSSFVGNGSRVDYADEDGTETVGSWECAEGCPVRALDEQRGYAGDSGTASRFFPQFEGQAPPEAPFFYCPKATKKEATLEGQIKNTHPTKKPVNLMKWVCRLLCPKGGLVLDPYCGSGSTLQAAVEEGMQFTGIELDPKFVDTAQSRMVIVLRVAGEDRVDRDMYDTMGDVMDEFDE